MNVEDFTTVIVDEAIVRSANAANYGSGWTFKPFHFALLEDDILEPYIRGKSEESIYQYSSEASEKYGEPYYELADDLITKLCQFNTDSYNELNLNNKVWFESSFAGLEGEGESVTHTINIPGNVSDTSCKINTIVFLYENNYGSKYVHAVARANKPIVFVPGITQTFVFQFTISRERQVTGNNLIVNYTYPQDIANHNNSYTGDTNYNNVHPFFLDTEGVRKANQVLHYNEPKDFTNESPNAIPDKAYVDAIIDIVINQICPPGSLMWWTGTVDDIPEGWCIRDGRILNRKDNPILWKRLDNGERYRNEFFVNNPSGRYNYKTYLYEPGTELYVKENDNEQFPIMDDRGLFIRGTETYSNGINTKKLHDIGIGEIQKGGAPEISGIAGCSWFSKSGAKHPYIGKVQITGCFGILPNSREGGSGKYFGVNDGSTSSNDPGMDFKASRCSTEYSEDIDEVRPINRNYIPIIRLG